MDACAPMPRSRVLGTFANRAARQFERRAAELREFMVCSFVCSWAHAH
jgi:hypothetical protein